MNFAESLASLICDSEHCVVFTGAGMSTESGIPDFRGPQGLWKKMKPVDFNDFVSSETVRQNTWQSWFEHSSGLLRAEPNAGHRAIANLVLSGHVSAVITQNVDNLHQQSGVPAERVIELHGNASYAKCLSCGRRSELADIEREFAATRAVAPCSDCGGIIKTATISFGQMMPEEPMRRCEQETLESDLFIVLGSSLTVYPAAGFPQLAANNGAKLVIINQEPTALDSVADLTISDSIGKVVTAAAEIVLR